MIFKTGGLSVNLSNYSSSVSILKDADIKETAIRDNNINSFINEMQKMKNIHILKNMITDYEETNIEYSIYGREYNSLKHEYLINKVALTTDGTEMLGAEIEEKTGKILYYVSTPKYNIVEDIDKEEILRNYIKYLELYIIDDWKYENNILISEKARLMTCLMSYDNTYILAIFSTNNEYIRERYNLK